MFSARRIRTSLRTVPNTLTPNPDGPPTINLTTTLEWATQNSWFEITYDQLTAASGANYPAGHVVHFTLAAINSGTLQILWMPYNIWVSAPTPSFGQPPTFLSPGGKARWLPPTNIVNSTGQLAFTIGLLATTLPNQRSTNLSEVFIKVS